MPEFKELTLALEKSFAINGKASTTLKNYLRCLAHLAIYFKCSPERLTEEQINDYLYCCQNLHKTPSESFFKHTVYGLRAAYKVLGLNKKCIQTPTDKKAKRPSCCIKQTGSTRAVKCSKILKASVDPGNALRLRSAQL